MATTQVDTKLLIITTQGNTKLFIETAQGKTEFNIVTTQSNTKLGTATTLVSTKPYIDKIYGNTTSINSFLKISEYVTVYCIIEEFGLRSVF